MKFSWVWGAHIIKRKIIDKNIVFALVEHPKKMFTLRPEPEDVLKYKAERREEKRREEKRREKKRREEERERHASTVFLGVPAGRVGIVTGHPGFAGGHAVVGSGAYGVPAVVPVAGTVYDPTPTPVPRSRIVGIVTGHPGFAGGHAVVGSGAYGVPAVVPVAGPVRPTHVTVYDPTPTGVYGIVTGEKPDDRGKRVELKKLGRVRFETPASSTSRSSGAGHGSSRCGVRSCTISHPQHYCNVCGKWDVTHQDYDCSLYKARASGTSRSSGAGHGSSRCGVRSCTISHPQHYCNVCGKWDVTHQDYDCPLYKARRH